MVLLHLNCHVMNLSASLKISLPYQAVYYYLLDNPVSGPSFVPTVIAALHPSNIPHPLFPLKNANKFRRNSNKLGKIGINWNRQ